MKEITDYSQDIYRLKAEVKKVLENNILPYWMDKMPDYLNGGFYGQITGSEELVKDAPKGAILNARILWTFAAAYRVLGRKAYLDMATRAKRYLIDHFYDSIYGGVYWSLDAKGNPVDTKKQIYALGFAVYGLSEYYRATQDAEALDYARRLYDSIEKHSFDPSENGYLEALTREWNFIGDMRLSQKDANEAKTMNTHLHILEPYTNLYRCWKDEDLGKQLRNLIELFLNRILDRKSFHLGLFFSENWENRSRQVSYGHDIEASWLIHEAALVLGDAELLQQVEQLVPEIARAAAEGLRPDGSMVYETDLSTGHTDLERHWWVQAETVVGYLNLFQHFEDRTAVAKAFSCWDFIKTYLMDAENGEWFWSVDEAGNANRRDDKAGFWKCPYHNGRMCLEIIERF